MSPENETIDPYNAPQVKRGQEDNAYFEKQIALERQALAELLLDIYESKLQKRARSLDAERTEPTMKERSKM